MDATNLLGNTPLHIACLNGQDIVITELISYGASVNATNKKGMVSGIYSTYSCNAIKQCPTVSNSVLGVEGGVLTNIVYPCWYVWSQLKDVVINFNCLGRKWGMEF